MILNNISIDINRVSVFNAIKPYLGVCKECKECKECKDIFLRKTKANKIFRCNKCATRYGQRRLRASV